MTGNPHYTADTNLSAQSQLHSFVYNSPPIAPFSKFHPLVSRIHPKGCMCIPVENHCYRQSVYTNYFSLKCLSPGSYLVWLVSSCFSIYIFDLIQSVNVFSNFVSIVFNLFFLLCKTQRVHTNSFLNKICFAFMEMVGELVNGNQVSWRQVKSQGKVLVGICD